ncbi:DUF397 domain-containing protein [Streptomyces sp. NBC_00264]|uniref:DUF397 domain-containing protein n=1 Tax=unclassified Streptomyces TaxID=2593676 RepID=UPI00224DD0EE|nr:MULTISPECIES: DUF397 domain-containing protein [unclassified Streptomyces]WSX01555.1 DUF397 domain-containing protein [Streptomyces sp. NBC_00987]MCX4396552.1 DUF397 domain-containing protein [Streptomyces sp. NBC_01767]MCX5100801.1 DUF397 domain-containing protein [Streptomyces sp. NBC_00439]MCX5160322.1 DUF397 domain-containing protein [Streptomyces sp. NBC_00305]MCX5218845.1 DUF397 domain-containing protein [Streptomyces sp. NBC_00264]
MDSTKLTIADSAPLTGWRKSSYSGGANAECLEVADGYAVVPVRDSKAAPTGPTIVFTAEGWTSFVSAVKGDCFAV